MGIDVFLELSLELFCSAVRAYSEIGEEGNPPLPAGRVATQCMQRTQWCPTIPRWLPFGQPLLDSNTCVAALQAACSGVQ
eukprot:6564231-Alexandrium_andersonii.AAC.1